MSDWTISPDPPCRGQTAVICYLGDLPDTIVVDIDGVQTHYPLDSERCFEVQIPSDAVALVAHAQGSGCDDLTRAPVNCG